MKEAELNQAGLAKAASTKGRPVTQQNIQQLLGGRNKTSKHLPALARALKVNLVWLAEGDGEMRPTGGREALLVGKVGAGSEITRFDEGTVMGGLEVNLPEAAVNAAVIEGDSQFPLQPGWLIFYGPEHQGVPDACLGKLCVVQVKDGPTLLKTLKTGKKKNLFRLESWNAPPREDERLVWAAQVFDIRPR